MVPLWTCVALQVGFDIPTITSSSSSFFPQRPDCGIFWCFGELDWCHSLFRLQVVHSPFISSHCGCQEAVIFCIIAEFSDRCPRSFPPVQESFVDTLWNCTTSWTMWWAEPRLMSNIGTAVFVLTLWFLPNDAFSLCSRLMCYDSVGLSHFSVLCNVRHTSFKISSYTCCGDTCTCYCTADLWDVGCQ